LDNIKILDFEPFIIKNYYKRLISEMIHIKKQKDSNFNYSFIKKKGERLTRIKWKDQEVVLLKQVSNDSSSINHQM